MIKYDKPLAKIKRARSVVEELKAKETSFYADGHYRVVVLDEPTVGVRYFDTKMLDDMGEVFTPIIADALHNIRAALDAVLYEIMVPLLQASDNRKLIKFPFESDTVAHGRFYNKPPMSRTPPAVRDKINEISHPDAADKEIRAFHYLDIQDKHQDGFVVVHSSSLSSFRLQDFDPQAMNLVMENSSGVVTKGLFSLAGPLNAYSVPCKIVQAKIDRHMQSNMTFQARFSDKEPLFANELVSDVLLRIATRVETAILELREAAKVTPADADPEVNEAPPPPP
jgi:hypothetical protein